MKIPAGTVAQGLVLAILAAGLGYAATYATKHYVPALWFLWLGSGGLIAFAIAWWKPRYSAVAGLATPSLVLIETARKMGDVPPTAAALGLGFGMFWGLLSVLGAVVGRARGAGPRR